ncbi:metallophosphoesterase family protein [Chlorogloea sp. CCALA 695]|uniref:metallophosphoesterase family protein n=1 Tax=Chlorogloea sp. CCALA 695 TaxID=2107693 RepID=UPI000D080156|nr:metallophosphoesterase [Chlorogloea sp. CCALA 695]PSB35384.1 metallophosphoesterase [Chlorogloea sp. CCALA 695]
MRFVSDPPISVKIRKMKQRVRWQDKVITERGIDQTKLVLGDRTPDNPNFSFLVVGDSGAGPHGGHNPQRQVAMQMLNHKDSSRFVLHTGDVIYLVGSSEYYYKNFIKPYREFIVGGEHPKEIDYDKMVFNKPFLPVLGNHDYYDLPFIYGLMAQTALPLRRLLQSKLDIDIGWHGSHQGKAYAQAFMDYLKGFEDENDLIRHLDRHYTAKTNSGRCLYYEPGSFTRLPNRYYSFQSGGVDFFALDSNTFNSPSPLSKDIAGLEKRRQLEQNRDRLEREKISYIEESTKLNSTDSEQLDDLRTKIEQLDELRNDIDKQLAADETTMVDTEQLDWFANSLIESWHNPDVRGRVVYFHHPPYVTEATKWHQSQTIAVRLRFREVLNKVARKLGSLNGDRPLVNLVLNGHAHCLEYLRTGNTGHADAHINWIVCGGSGFSLRRQRSEGVELTENPGGNVSARSLLYIGRAGQGSQKRRPYSFLRIDVLDGIPAKFVIRPFVVERFQGKWSNSEIQPFVI